VQGVRVLFRALIRATDPLGQVEGVPDKEALAALKEAKRKLDDLYLEVTSRKASNTANIRGGYLANAD
jgi:hypothetical protein